MYISYIETNEIDIVVLQSYQGDSLKFYKKMIENHIIQVTSNFNVWQTNIHLYSQSHKIPGLNYLISTNCFNDEGHFIYKKYTKLCHYVLIMIMNI